MGLAGPTEAEVCWNGVEVVRRPEEINYTKKITTKVEVKTEAILCMK